MKMTRRAQVALAHLHFYGEYNSVTFPLGSRDKYLGTIATELRRFMKDVNATVAKFRLPDSTRGYIIVPTDKILRKAIIDKALLESVKIPKEIRYYARELTRLGVIEPDKK